MRQKMVMGNWKMNGRMGQVTQLLQELRAALPVETTPICVVFPPAIYLPLAQALLDQSTLYHGAQNVYPQEAGAYTGELSGGMLSDYGCRYVLVGHSERAFFSLTLPPYKMDN